MQFIAILKDSIREALDARIFWIIGIIGGILVLLGLTMSFEPLPMGKVVIGNLITGLTGAEGRQGPQRGAIRRGGGNGLFEAFQGIFRQSDAKIVLLEAKAINLTADVVNDGNLPTSEWKLRLELAPEIAKNRGASDSELFLKEHLICR